jgi:cellulase/cellobiase CelA1
MSHYSAGGTYDGVFTQAQFYLCRMQATQPGATAVITTYFLDHTTPCSSGDHPRFKREVKALKRAIGNFSALVLVEEDASTAACWTSSSVIHRREQLLRYEIDQLSQLPHVLLYVEGGTEDSNTPRQVIPFLRASDATKARCFFVNDTHFMWTYSEIKYADQIARNTGLHFVVDTRANGQGPILNPNPGTQGVEQLCNPPGRGLGPPPAATNGSYSQWLDGFVWVTTPGDSSARTCPGSPDHWASAGVFDPRLAVAEATHANDRIGPPPKYPSRPY